MYLLWQGVAMVAIALGLAHLYSARQFQARTVNSIRALEQTPALLTNSADLEADAIALPPLVRAYAHRALPAERTHPRTVWVRQAGEMRLSPEQPWRSFEAQQYVSVRQPGFVWRARMRFSPLVRLSAVDRYGTDADGRRQGALEVRGFDSIPLVNATGDVTSKGQLMRYLAELPLCPDALLDNRELNWRPFGDRAVEVSAGEGSDRAVVRLEFDARGDVVGTYAAARPRSETELLPWRGIYSDFATIAGYRLPTRGEVSWILPDGTAFAYWRGRITDYAIDPDHKAAGLALEG
ncbi:MAG: DUF6544 family protein [Cyanobacteria bacterium J06648_11]